MMAILPVDPFSLLCWEKIYRTARAKGLMARSYPKHALRNAPMPVVTIIRIQFGVAGDAVVTETRLPGWGGRLIVNAISRASIIQGGVLMMAIIFTLVTSRLIGLFQPPIR